MGRTEIVQVAVAELHVEAQGIVPVVERLAPAAGVRKVVQNQ